MCNAVARGDLSQKITVPIQGVVMVQLKDVTNTMVSAIFRLDPLLAISELSKMPFRWSLLQVDKLG